MLPPALPQTHMLLLPLLPHPPRWPARSQEEAVAVSGWNWGRADLDGASLTFRVGVGSDKPAFHVPLPDVTQAQTGKDELVLEFPVDDTVAGGCDGGGLF